MRTVSAKFQTTYWPDDGSKTTVSSPPPDGWTAKAILVPDATTGGYSSIAISLDANQGFSLPDVPAGPYFLQLDRAGAAFCQSCTPDLDVEVVETQLIELRSDSPDLTVLSAARPDVARVDLTTLQPLLQLEVTDLAPWTTGDSVRTASSQGFHYGLLLGSRATPGATAASGPWGWLSDGLVDGSKGDIFYAYQRSTTPVGSGATAGTVSAASKYVRLTDLTLTQSSTTTSVALASSAPQTGAVRADLRYSQFAALAASVHPSAVPSATFSAGFSIQAVPHSAGYPDMPSGVERTSLLLLNSPGTPSVDVDYGTVHYGQFLDPLWSTYRQVFYAFDSQVPIGTGPPGTTLATLISLVPLSSDPGAITPALGPPTQPRIEGRDAFSQQTGVGLQPTITWSPPALGHASSYQVTITRQTQPVIAGEARSLSAVVYSSRAFKVPAGFLKQGSSYTAVITARSGPWDTFDHAPFLLGTPFHTADCLVNVFEP
jgi:hypothetical protein